MFTDVPVQSQEGGLPCIRVLEVSCLPVFWNSSEGAVFLFFLLIMYQSYNYSLYFM
jgi:hypothetical protein